MAGTGFDDAPVYYSDPFFSEDRSEADGGPSRTASLGRFKEFIKTFLDQDNCFCYRDQLKRHYNLRQYWMQVDLEDLSSFDSQLADKLSRSPSEYLPLVSTRVVHDTPQYDNLTPLPGPQSHHPPFAFHIIDEIAIVLTAQLSCTEITF